MKPNMFISKIAMLLCVITHNSIAILLIIMMAYDMKPNVFISKIAMLLCVITHSSIAILLIWLMGHSLETQHEQDNPS